MVMVFLRSILRAFILTHLLNTHKTIGKERKKEKEEKKKAFRFGSNDVCFFGVCFERVLEGMGRKEKRRMEERKTREDYCFKE
ncbi:hypothetical protein ES319_A09G166400v1 [Gossypium barbadense]|uniref:Secreted protein n=1 Tax=Gossypium barbadense TaxID=3634 RepID=A0A5J5UG53_GOSBA|nr:hypothetical protein ES319_A09G166400v1 [Gossypium barbadense]